MTNVVDFDTGIKRIYEVVHRFEKPVLVSVHSPGRNHGKSTLIRRLMEELYQNGMHFTSEIYSELFSSADMEPINGHDGHFLDIGGASGPKYSKDMVNCSALSTFGKTLDYSVFIYNPQMALPDVDGLRSVMDLVIINPDSSMKGKIQF